MTTHPIAQPPDMPPRARGTRSIVLGVLSLSPIAAGASLLALWAFTVWRDVHAVASLDSSADLGASFLLVGVVMVVGAATTVAAFVMLLLDVFTNPRVTADRQLTWVLVLLFGSVLAFPVYWYVVWWHEPALSAAR